jgi:tRNA modification GTPase
MYIQDTICAIATPVGEGGISIIRISGNESFNIVESLFSGKGSVHNYKPFTLHHGKIVDPVDGIIDEVLIGIFRNPNSFTGEDVIEINSHGGRLVTKRILNILLRNGARLAEPGEFTKRAFLNGKMDLTQAEAISDIIHAKSDVAIKFSLKSLSGEYGKNITKQHRELIDICALVELELDFIEDDIKFVEKNTILKKINDLLLEIDRMISSFEFGKLYKDGVKVVLLGKPNVGKSTILNSLLLSDRAIVSDIPGTTRDFIEEAFQYDGILFRLIDTAGLRITIDEIEQKGIDRTRDQIKEADILVYIFDLTQNYNKSDWEIFREYMLSAEESKQEGIVVFNKSDLVKNESTVEFIRINTNEFRKIKNILHISANKEQDIEILRKNFTDLVKKNQDNIDDTRVVTNIRHRTALINTKYSLLKAIEAIAANESNEFIAVHLRKSLNSLGEITGIVTTEEILNNIFSKFCIGK